MGSGSAVQSGVHGRPPSRKGMRPPADVMRLARLGAFHQTRISFVRSLVHRMAREHWQISRLRFDIDPQNVGEAQYRVTTPHSTYSFFVVAENIEPEQRTDRAIAERWDYTFALFDGELDAATIDRLHTNVPKQDTGRYLTRDLTFSRANKSVRAFDEVVDCLAPGRQPDAQLIADVGYLIRTTAVFANGKFGVADYGRLRKAGAFPQPFSAQMLTVYLARQFSLDLVDHIALRRNPDGAVSLSYELRRHLGVGNATGLGMAPFVVGHPKVFHQWISAREEAIAQVKAQASASTSRVARFRELLDRAIRHVEAWRTADERQIERLVTLTAELRDFHALCFPGPETTGLPAAHPWRYVAEHAAEHYSLETQELLNSLILEPYPDLVDELEDSMSADETEHLRPGMPLRELKAEIEKAYDWALAVDFNDPRQRHYFWYRSETKEEPRLGVRGAEPGEDRELPVDIGWQAAQLYHALTRLDGAAREESTARFLLRNPAYRAIARRIQTHIDYPYAEVRDNLLSADCLPLDLLRCKLAFFGASGFDSKSDRWTRITLFQGAPLPKELLDASIDADDWFCPVLQRTP